MNKKLKKKRNTYDHFASRSAENRLKIFHMFTNFICYNYLEFHKNCIDIYRIINMLLKMPMFLSFNREVFYWNCTKLLESMMKYTEIILLNFKTNVINIQRDMVILRKYFLTAYASMITKTKRKKNQNSVHYSIRELTGTKPIEYAKNWKRYLWLNELSFSFPLKDAW